MKKKHKKKEIQELEKQELKLIKKEEDNNEDIKSLSVEELPLIEAKLQKIAKLIENEQDESKKEKF